MRITKQQLAGMIDHSLLRPNATIRTRKRSGDAD